MAELIIKNDKGEILYRTSEAELLRLGRDRTNTFCIEDEHISLQHCEILWDPKRGASIRDNGSYNGTRILRKKGDGIIGITVGQRPYYEDRDAAHKYVSEYRLLENGDRIRLYSGCILTVEYNLSETVADEKPFDRVGDVGPAEKESKEIEAKEEPVKTNIYESKREPVYPKTVIDTDNSNDAY